MAGSTTLRNAGIRPSVRAKAGVMAHRHSVASRNVALVVFCILLAFVFFMALVQVSNQVNGLRSRIAALQDRQEYLEANGASLLAEWNKATQCETITNRAARELGLQMPDGPAFVLVRNGNHPRRASWHEIFQGLSQSEANAAEVPGNATPAPVLMLDTP